MRLIGSLIAGFHLLFASAFAVPSPEECADKLGMFVVPDLHANLRSLPNLIATISVRRRLFEAECPGSTFAVFFNGDSVSDSRYTNYRSREISRDHGWFVHETKVHLSRVMWVGESVGNHEEFDFVKTDGIGDRAHRIYHNNIKKLIKHIGPDYRVLAANLTPGKLGQGLFSPHRDIQLRNGKVVRVVGMVLEEFWARTNYNRESNEDVILSIDPMIPSAIKALEQAARDKVDRLVFGIHDTMKNTRVVAEALDAYQASLDTDTEVNRRAKAMPHDLWMSGHDHKRDKLETDRRKYRQGGSNGDALFYVVDSDGVEVIEYYPQEIQKWFLRDHPQLYGKPTGTQSPFLNGDSGTFHEGLAWAKATERLEKIDAGILASAREKYGAEIVNSYYEIPDFFAPKSKLKEGPEAWGTYLADILVKYAIEDAKKNGHNLAIPTVAIYNSSSSKVDTLRQNETVGFAEYYEFAESVYPHHGRLDIFGGDGVHRITGAMFQELVLNMRAGRAEYGVYSPQLSSTVREVSDGTLEILVGDAWVPAKEVPEVRFPVDPFSARNGYQLSGPWSVIASRNKQNELDGRLHAPMGDRIVDELVLNGRRVDCSKLIAIDAMIPFEGISRETSEGQDRVHAIRAAR